jgi:DNA repair ATPase RecN
MTPELSLNGCRIAAASSTSQEIRYVASAVLDASERLEAGISDMKMLLAKFEAVECRLGQTEQRMAVIERAIRLLESRPEGRSP